MNLAGTALNASVIGAVGLMLWLAIRGRLVALERRLDRMEERFDRRIDRLEEQVVALRADLTQVALAVGAKPRADSG